MLSAETINQVEKFLLANGIVNKKSLENARMKAAQDGASVIDALIAQKTVSDDDIVKATALVMHVPFVDLSNQIIPENIQALVPKETARNYQAVPFGITDGELNVAMVDPTDLQAIDFITKKSGHPVKAYMTTKANLERLLMGYKEDLGEQLSQAFGPSAPTQDGDKDSQDKSKKSDKIDDKNIASFVQDAPITRALNTIMEYAVNSRASDIHIEPRRNDLRIRYRIDGMLHEIMTLPKTIEPALISRIKIMANLKIDEHRVPQDGQANFATEKHEVDLRIAIAPIANGEQVVIRILDKNARPITLDNLGFRGRSFRVIEQGINKPHGMILSTGPTGSGKTTSMYAIISKIKDVSINIVTLEDPIEYKIDDINQTQVNARVGLTFATGLRSILRQDPNVIMVGEIRDSETADLAVQSALTGHLVLSTLHTNSASGVLPRLLDMKIEPFLIASTVNVVIGQRLVRKVCDNCRVEEKASDAAVAMINKYLKDIMPKSKADVAKVSEDLGYDDLPIYNEKAYTLYHGTGCDKCVKGYLGRIGVYEVFEMNEAMEKLLLSHATTSDVQRQAIADGMISMLQDGLLKALKGITTLEEVGRVASDY